MPEINITDWHANYAERTVQWAKIRDVIDGEDKIKNQGQTYLPKPSGMTGNKQYDAYKLRTAFYPICERTMRGLTGMVFRHAPVLEIPERMEPMRENLTTDGYSFEVLAEEVVREVLTVGRYGILPDFPVYNEASNVLPHFATYFAEDIINWEQAFIEGKKVLTRIVLRDDIDNTFGDDTVQYLELILNQAGQYEVRKWKVEVSEQQSVSGIGSTKNIFMTEATVPLINGAPLNRIPFVFINTFDLRPDIEKPPFLDLANVNLGHYRNSADYEHALYLTAQPTAWIAGQLDETKKPTSIGSGTIWYLPEDTKVGMLEFTGAGVESQRAAMQDKETRMSSLGAQMIKTESRSNETAETARLHGRGETSLLTNAVNMSAAGLRMAFRISAEWVGAKVEEVDAKLNKDFVETRLAPEEVNAIVKAWQGGAISRTTMHENMQSGEIMPPTRTVEEEKELIEEEGGGLYGLLAPIEPEPAANEPEEVEEGAGNHPNNNG